MRKLKVYLDTSVISHLDAPDVPEKQEDTRKLWEQMLREKYLAAISDVTIDEIDRCPEPKRTFMLERLAQLQYEELPKSDEAAMLSRLYFEEGGLPPKSRDDAMHIAIATAAGCDVILSWNFKHIVNLRAITAVESINIRQHYPILRIFSPTMLLEGDEPHE